MKVNDIAKIINDQIPLKLAQGWDNVGLLLGDRDQHVRKILLAIDVTENVVAEAKETKTDMIVSYHPIIWDGLKKVTSEFPTNNIYQLIRSGISVFSIHTALDVVTGGVNDGLAEIIGISDGRAIGDFVDNPAKDNYKLVIFVPQPDLAKVTNAVYAAGAGHIGNYSNCGFETAGVGTFLPLQGSKPAIGKQGKLEEVLEVRFETIVPAENLSAVIKAMKNAHPYEEPAFDCFKIHDFNGRSGLGRIGKLKEPSSLDNIIQKIKKHTGAKSFGIVGPEKRMVKTAAVCAGSCGKIINLVIAENVDLYLTGELKHHQAMAAQEANLTCICLSHTVSERFILKKISKMLQKHAKEVKITISKKDHDPFNWKKL